MEQNLYLVIFSTSISAYMLTKLISCYLDYKVSTTTRKIRETSSVFPKVILIHFKASMNSSKNIFDEKQRENLTQNELNELIIKINRAGHTQHEKFEFY